MDKLHKMLFMFTHKLMLELFIRQNDATYDKHKWYMAANF